MKSDVVIKIVDSDGNAIEVGTGKEWAFQRGKGLSDFATFSGTIEDSDNYARDGSNTENVRLSAKDRTINIIHTMPWDCNASREQFTSFLRYNALYKVYITYMGRTRWAEGRLYKMKLSEDTQIDKLMKATLTFRFDNPYLMSVDDFGKNIASVTAGIGFPWLVQAHREVPVGYFNFDRAVDIVNDGDSIAYPVIRVKATDNVVKPIVRINDGWVRLNSTMKREDELVLDFNATPPTIRLNGENVLGRCDRQSNFDDMELIKGKNTVSFDAEQGTDEIEVFVVFNKMYTVI
jgi:hypothetical protein